MKINISNEQRKDLIEHVEKYIRHSQGRANAGLGWDKKNEMIYKIMLNLLTSEPERKEIPTGFMLVPIIPSYEMLSAGGCKEHAEGEDCIHHQHRRLIWEKMIFATPVASFNVWSIADDAKKIVITLPDHTSKAFWSGQGKKEVFHPETYKRWVKESVERASVIAGINIEIKG